MTRHQLHDQFGLFVWRQDGRYHVDDALALYASEHRADRTATAMNRRGEHAGMVVVRQYFSRAERAAPRHPDHQTPAGHDAREIAERQQLTDAQVIPATSFPPLHGRLLTAVLDRVVRQMSVPDRGIDVPPSESGAVTAPGIRHTPARPSLRHTR